MKSLDEYLREAEAAHGHLCAGQVLGVRMAMAGLSRLGIADPRGADRKRLVTYVEIDRCATDAIMVVTGCRLGKDRKSTRLNSSHLVISYAVFCLKKKKTIDVIVRTSRVRCAAL